MKLDKHVVDMFTELTKPADDVKMEKTCYGTISVVDGTRYIKLDGSDLLVPAASTVKTSHGDRVTVLMKNHSLTVTGNLTAPATDGEGGSSGEAGTAATIKVGTVTTGEAGSSASVTNSGTTSAAVFDFVIPKGDKGEKGDTGTWDGTIPDHEHTVSDITDFPTSLPANGGNADTVDGKHSYEITPYHPVNDRPYRTLTARIENAGKEVFKTILRNNDGTINATAKFAAMADGGNADTIDGLHANEIASNPNLLDNPDFKINQRGLTTYTGSGYTVDRWSGSSYLSVDVNDNGITISANGGSGYFTQVLIENISDLYGKMLTGTIALENHGPISISGMCPSKDESAVFAETALPGISSVFRIYKSTISETGEIFIGFRVVIRDGESVTITSSKLELGSVATPFCPPDPATELLKVQSMNDIGTLKLISNSTLPTIMNSQMVNNPNLLINPNFKINQRGQSEYASGYTVDRWSLDPNKASVSVETDGVNITSAKDITSNTHVLWQWLEFPLPPGKYTLSVNVKEVTGSWSARIRTVDADGTFVASYYTPTLCTGVNKVSANLPENEYISAVSVGFNNGTGVGDSVKLEWIKLEMGSCATPFCPPDPATELIKCQRYYYKFIHSNPQDSTDNCTIGEAFAINSNTIIAILPVPATRHGVYSSVDYKNVQIVKGLNGKIMYDGNITALEQTDSTIQLVFTIANQTAGDRYRVRLIGSDAYIALDKEI